MHILKTRIIDQLRGLNVNLCRDNSIIFTKILIKIMP